MSGTGFFSLLGNVGLLALLVVSYAALAAPLSRLPVLLRQTLSGLGFGLAGVGLMALPLQFAPGLQFDGRAVPILLAAPFGGGPLAAVVAGGMTIGSRLHLGGPGVLPSLLSALATVGLSTWLWWLRRRGGRFDAAAMAMAAAGNVAVVGGSLFLLGSGTALAIIAGLGPAYAAVTLIGTALFGQLLLLDDRRREALVAAEQARQLADEANRAKSRFLAQMSHELRTPLTGVLGMIDLMKDAGLPPASRAYLDAMQSSSRALLSLVDDILDFSKIEAERVTLSPAETWVHRLARDVMNVFEAQAARNALSLTLTIDEATPETIRCDEQRVRQILLNLVGNALKFTERGGVELFVGPAAGAEGTALAFEVRDSGIGIGADRLDEVFEPFEQEDGTTGRRFGGSGLGLSISRRLAELMGGTLTVRSEKGTGSVFTLKLPVPEPLQAAAGPGAAAPATGEPVAQPESPLAGLRVLVAEDTAVTRLLLREMLQRLGAEPSVVENGAQAVEQVRQGDFDAVLMDVQMPVLDGLEATRRIRALGGRRARLPIFGLTADAVAEHRQGYLAAGLDAVLNKPVDWAALVATLEPLRRASTGRQAADGSAVPLEALIAQARERPALDLAVRQVLAEAIAPGRFEEIVGLWPAFAEEHLALLRGAAEAGDADALARAAHSVKGTAGYLGYLRLEALCRIALEHPEAEGERGRALTARLVPEICDELEWTLHEFRGGGAGELQAVT